MHHTQMYTTVSTLSLLVCWVLAIESVAVEPESDVSASLVKRVYADAHYSTYLLEIRTPQPTAVTATFDMRQKSRKLASIPLKSIGPKKPGPMNTFLFRVNCVADELVDDTSCIHVRMSDRSTGDNIAELKVCLHEAKPVDRLPDAK